MIQPTLDDQIVPVWAGLTDEDFGYDHWRAAQYASPWKDRPGVLLLFENEAQRKQFILEWNQKAGSQKEI